jgi:hypothetical protein
LSGPIPTLGFPSRSQAAVWLRGQGKSLREIAGLIGVETAVVSALIASGRRGKRPCDPRGADEIRIMLGGDTLSVLQVAAAQRNTTPSLLVTRLLTQAARDGIIDAILDDGGRP